MNSKFSKKPLVLAMMAALGYNGAVLAAGDIIQIPGPDASVIVQDSDTGNPERFRVKDSGEVYVRSLPGTVGLTGAQVTCFNVGDTGPTGPGGNW